MSPERFHNDFYPLRDSLYRTAFYILESRDDAMDAVQDIFLKIWQNGDDLDTVHNPKAYCQTLVRNLCLDRLRSKQMRDRADLGELLDERAESQEKTLSEREELRLLSKAIEELPQREKLVITKKSTRRSGLPPDSGADRNRLPDAQGAAEQCKKKTQKVCQRI